VLLVPGLKDQGLGGNALGEGHAGLPGDGGHRSLPCLLLRLGSFFPRREASRVGATVGLVCGSRETFDAAHVSMMAEDNGLARPPRPWSLFPSGPNRASRRPTRTDGGWGGEVKRIQHPCGVGGVGKFLDLATVGPSSPGGLDARGR
jgi:hypothetical protein